MLLRIKSKGCDVNAPLQRQQCANLDNVSVNGPLSSVGEQQDGVEQKNVFPDILQYFLKNILNRILNAKI